MPDKRSSIKDHFRDDRRIAKRVLPMGVERVAVARMNGCHSAAFGIALMSEEDRHIRGLKISKGDVVVDSSTKIDLHDRSPTRS
jgi:hypothetical protein